MTIQFIYLAVVGLKRGDWRVDFTSRNVLVLGPNGSGKSAVRNALEFLFGLKIEGAASGQGQGIIGLVSGDVLRVECGLLVDGERHIIARERRFERGTFKAAVVTIDGEVVDAKTGIAALLGGDVMMNPGADLLNASADALRAELARLALMIKSGAGDTGEMPTTPEALSAERERRKKAVNEANAALRAAQQSLDASVKRAPDSTARPDALEAAKVDAARAREAHQQWAAEHAAVQARVNAAQREVDAWERRRVGAVSERDRLVRERDDMVSRGVASEADAQSAISRAARAIEATETNLAFANDALRDEHDAKAQAQGDAARAAEKHRAALAAREALAHDTCPTCGQAVTAALLGSFDAVVADCAAAVNGANSALASAGKKIAEVVTEIDGHRRTLETERKAHADATAALQRAQRLALLNSQIETHNKAVVQITSERPASPDAIAAELRAVETRRPAPSASEDKIAQLSAELNAHQRLLADKSARDAAQAQAESAKKAAADLAAYEESLVHGAADVLCKVASDYLDGTGWGVIIDTDRGVCLDVPGDSGAGVWYGAGMSGAQRKVLEAALSEAVLSITGAAVRISAVEADEVSGHTLTCMMGALEDATARGSLALALVITCHSVGASEHWQQIGTLSAPGVLGDDPEMQTVVDSASDAALLGIIDAMDAAEAAVFAAIRDWGVDGQTEPEPVTTDDDDDWGGGWGDPPDDAAPEPIAAEAVHDATEPPIYITDDLDTEAPEQPLTVADAKAMLRDAKLSTDALRDLAARPGAKLTASPLIQIAGERAVRLGLGAGAWTAMIFAADKQHPKRGYSKRPADADGADAPESTDGEPATEGSNDADA